MRVAHSLPGEGRGRDLSGQRKKAAERGALTIWIWQREGLVRTQGKQLSKGHSLLPGGGRGRDVSGHGKKEIERGTLTDWRQQREELIRTRKGDRARCTHSLETAEGGTCQDTERRRLSETHSLTGDNKGRNLSGHGKETGQGALTTWRQQREELVRTRKESNWARGTHFLDTV